MVAPRRSTLWKAISLSHTEEKREVLCGMVVAVNLFKLDRKIGVNPYIAVGVDTRAGLASPPAVKTCKVVKPRSYWV
jgi:hypothetical protein